MDRRIEIKIPSSSRERSSYGNEASPTTRSSAARPGKEMESRRRSRIATLRPAAPSTQICIDFGEAVRSEALPLTPCGRCGLEFCASSIVFHRQTCRGSQNETPQKKTGIKRKGLPVVTQNSVEVAGKAGDGARKEAIVTTIDPSPLEEVAGVRLFGAPCKFCGERFGKHSLQLHVKRCREANQTPKMYTVERPRERENIASVSMRSVTVGAMESCVVDAAADSVSHQIQLGFQQLRPQTRSLGRSVLLEKGLALPSIDGSSGVTRCGSCGEMVSSGALSLHQVTCRPPPRTITRGEISFPALDLRPRMTTRPPHNHPPNSRLVQMKTVAKRPPTVVCYICGREYGTKSISIHEPQCLERFESENRRLPVRERKPLPRKPITHTATVEPVGRRLLKVAIGATAVDTHRNEEILQATTDEYFQHCYREWENDLVPCKKCGRKFAPERHVKHAPRCRAKPLPDLAPK